MIDQQLTDHFWLREFLRSQVAARHGIDMTPDSTIIYNLTCLCAQVLEPLRHALGGRPIVITSGYRPLELNNLIGGSKTSAHPEGRAADIIVPGFEPRYVCHTVSCYVKEYDQNIHEFGDWTHVGIAKTTKENRKEDLTAYRISTGETRYARGILRIEDLEG